MTFGAREVYESSFAEQIHYASVGEMVRVNVAGDVVLDLFRGVVEIGDVDLDIEVT
jgi:hypothetical protein